MTADEWPLAVRDDYGDTVISCAFPVTKTSKFHPELTWPGTCDTSLGVMSSSFTITELRGALAHHIPRFHGSG